MSPSTAVNMRFRLLQICLLWGIGHGLANAQFNGGLGHGDGLWPGLELSLNGESNGSRFAGNGGRGDQVVAFSAVHLDGEFGAAPYLGSPGRGDAQRLTGSSMLSGEQGGMVYSGTVGRGDSHILLSASGISGEAQHLLFQGSNGRGDNTSLLQPIGLDGEEIYLTFQGGMGRGDAGRDAYTEILDCSHYAVWTGLVSTAWADPANWQCNEVPNRYSDVIIPGSAPHFPQITAGPVEIRNLHLQANSSLQALTALLRVLGGPQ